MANLNSMRPAKGNRTIVTTPSMNNLLPGHLVGFSQGTLEINKSKFSPS